LISDTLQGTIVGGIIGFGSSLGVGLIQNWLSRPIICISEETTEVLFGYKFHRKSIKQKGELLGITPVEKENEGDFSTVYVGTRIKVENRGSKAAENCKASIIIRGNEYRVGWMIPKDDFTVTINANDVEYIDLCALGQDQNRILTTEHGYGDLPDEARKLEDGNKEGHLKVSASNAKQCVRSIRISDVPDSQGKFVYLNKSS
jgi:hypothetical protein